MSQQPTIAQLHNLTDRAQRGPLTADETARLREGINQLAALQAVARGYCPTCGRGDAGPTTEDWEQQRRRADHAEQRIKAALVLHQPMQRGPFTICAHCSGWDGKWRCQGVVTNYPCPTIRALDQPGPAATQATEPDTSARPWSTCTVPADHAPHPWHDPWPLPHGQDAHCPGRPTPDPKEQP